MKQELLRPDFYWIPSIVALSVQPHEAFVFAVVYWFTNLKDGRCFASNQRLAEALPYKSTPISVANALTALEREGLIYRIFKDDKKRVRDEIVCLVKTDKVSPTNDRVSPTGDTGITHRCNRVSPTGEQRNNNEEEDRRRKHTSEATASRKYDPIGAEIIKAFSEWNPAASKYYNNTTQRKACDDLIESYGLQQVLNVIAILPKTNGQPFIPTVTTPLLLRDKWVQLEVALRRKKEEIIKNNNCIIL